MVALAKVFLPTEEIKFFDTAKSTTTAASSGTVLSSSLVLIEQGNGESNRIGRKCVVSSLHMRGKIHLPTTTPNQSADVCRIIVYVDRACNGLAATVALLLASADYRSFRNLDNSGRFRTLMDQSFAINIQGAAGDGTTNATNEAMLAWSLNKRVTVPLEFDASTGAITDLTGSNIGVIAISDSGLAEVDYIARVRFSG